MPISILMTYCKKGYSWADDVLLVRVAGRKAVRIITSISHDLICAENIIAATNLAHQKGWRKIVIATDNYKGQTLRGFNLHQYHYEQWQKGYIGVFLGFV